MKSFRSKSTGYPVDLGSLNQIEYQPMSTKGIDDRLTTCLITDMEPFLGILKFW